MSESTPAPVDVLEALLFASDTPLEPERIRDVLELGGVSEVRALVDELRARLGTAASALQITEVAGGFRMVTRQALAPWLVRLARSRTRTRMSRPALETLAIVGYRQPVSRPEIDAIRGVNSEGVLDSLLERRLVRIAGRKDAPGRPFLYETTREFLVAFGLRDLAELPKIDGELIVPALSPDSAAAATADGRDADPSEAAEQTGETDAVALDDIALDSRGNGHDAQATAAGVGEAIAAGAPPDEMPETLAASGTTSQACAYVETLTNASDGDLEPLADAPATHDMRDSRDEPGMPPRAGMPLDALGERANADGDAIAEVLASDDAFEPREASTASSHASGYVEHVGDGTDPDGATIADGSAEDDRRESRDVSSAPPAAGSVDEASERANTNGDAIAEAPVSEATPEPLDASSASPESRARIIEQSADAGAREPSVDHDAASIVADGEGQAQQGARGSGDHVATGR